MRRVKVDPMTGEDMVDPLTGEDMYEDEGPETPTMGAGHEAEGAFGERDPQGYQQPEYLKAQLSGTQPGAFQALKPVAQFAGDVGQAISTGPINAVAQAAQDKGFAPVEAVKNLAKNFATPFHTFEKPIQSTETSLERAGVPNAPQPPPMRYPGEVFPGGDAPIMGLADQAGMVADYFTPPFAGAAAFKAAGATGRAAGRAVEEAAAASKSAIASKLQPAAEKAILGNYRKQLRAEFLPDNPSPGTLKNFPRELARTLKENDLLRPPEQAKINLNAGLEKTGGEINRVIQKATAMDVTVNAQKILDGYASDARAILRSTGKGAAEIKQVEDKILPQIQEIIQNLGPDEIGNIPLDKGVEFRRSLQAMVKNWDGNNKNLIQLVAKKLSNSMNKEIEAAHPIFGPRLAKLNEKYASLKEVEPMIDEAYFRAGGLESGPMINDRGLPLTKEGIVNQAVRSIGAPREALMRMMPKTAERIANDQYLPTGSSSPIPEYISRPPTVTADELSALGLDVGPKPNALPPRTPQGRPALDKPPTYVQGQPKEGLPPRTPTNTRRSFEDKPTTYMREPAEGLPPRDPKYPRRPLEPDTPRIRKIKIAIEKATSEESRKRLLDILENEIAELKKNTNSRRQ